MFPINEARLTGNLGGDPDVRNYESGKKMARFSMCTKEEFTTMRGEKGADVQWHYVVGWGDVATQMETFSKGDFVQVTGRLITRNWIDKAGNKRYLTEIIVSEMKKVE